MRQTALHSHIPLTRHSDQEEQGWAISQGRIALACQSSGLPSMHLQFLGGFQLACGDTPITSINVPRLQSLLAYLVLHARVPQSRTRLRHKHTPICAICSANCASCCLLPLGTRRRTRTLAQSAGSASEKGKETTDVTA